MRKSKEMLAGVVIKGLRITGVDTPENALPGGEILLVGAPWRVLRPSEVWGHDKQHVFRRQVKRVFRQR